MGTDTGSEEDKPSEKDDKPLETPETDDIHPLFSALPLLNQPTITGAHSIEIGIYLGMLGYGLMSIGFLVEALTLFLAVGRIIQSEWRVRSKTSNADHRIGLHDLFQKPIVFVAGVIFGFLILYILFIFSDSFYNASFLY